MITLIELFLWPCLILGFLTMSKMMADALVGLVCMIRDHLRDRAEDRER